MYLVLDKYNPIRERLKFSHKAIGKIININ
jgi:hypothetical protein